MKLPTIRIRLEAGLAIWLLSLHVGWSFYNPQTGRWLSRDPAEAKADGSLYAFVVNDPQAHIDPDGRISIMRVPHATETGRCGKFEVRWSFLLDDPLNWLIDGFFVQKVTREAQLHWCPCAVPGHIAMFPTYWEAWRLGPHGRPVGSNPLGDDAFQYEGNVRAGATPGSQGAWSWHNVSGELKFFPQLITGDLDVIWPRLDQAGGLPSTYDQPTWWDDPPEEGPAFHCVLARWDCCCPDWPWPREQYDIVP
jgi:hypothetical protein